MTRTYRFRYPLTLDQNVTRPVAGSVFTATLAALLRPELSWLMVPVFADCILRFIHPRLSPMAQIMKAICRGVLKIEPEPRFSPPKRFAVLIGMIVTGGMSVAYVLELSFAFLVLGIALLVASSLQAFVGYCIGCEIYNLLIKASIIRPASAEGDRIMSI